MAEQAKKNSGISKWFRELRSEIKKIVWPTWSQVVNNTLIVLATIFAVGIVIWIMDFFFQWLRDFLITLA